MKHSSSTSPRSSLLLGLGWSWFILLVVGCEGPKPEAVPAPLSPTVESKPSAELEPNAEPKPEPETRAPTEPTIAIAPYRRKGDIATGVDEFTFWGWSEDGRYFAFETFHHGAQMANCEGEAELSIVDASTDRYAEDGHVLLRYREAEAEVCDPPDLRVELGHRGDPRLKRLGISAAHGTGPSAFEGSGEHFGFVLPSGERAEVSFAVLHGTDDFMEAADGAAYELGLTLPTKPEQTIEPGRRRRPWSLSYNLEEGMVFIGPKGEHAALIVQQKETMPEGVRTTWTSNGVALR